MKSIVAIAIITAGVAAPHAAHAGDLRLGAQALFSPDGTIGYDVDGDTPYAYGLGRSYGATALVGYDLSPYVTVGVAPSALFGMQLDLEDADDTMTEVDVALHVAGRMPLTRGGLELQLHVAPGYSWILGYDEERRTPQGWVVGLGVGLAVPVSPRLSIVGDLSQSYGFHRSRGRVFTADGPIETDFEYEFDTVRLGVGVHATLW